MQPSPAGPPVPTPPTPLAFRIATVVLAAGALSALFLTDWRLLVAGVVLAMTVALVGA